MRTLLLLLFVFAGRCFATDYFIPKNSDLSAFNKVLLSGDKVWIERGGVYSGKLQINYSGIHYGTYGIGAKPIIAGLSFYKVSNVIVDSVNITDPSMSPTDHTAQAKISYGISINQSTFITIRYSDISMAGVCVEIPNGSSNNTFRYCSFTNGRMVRNTVGGDDDYGANGFVIGGGSNIIEYCYFKDLWANSYDYQYDGGAFEFFGVGIKGNVIRHNTVINCDGFIETGSNTSAGIIENNTFDHNLIINTGKLFYLNMSGGFGIPVKNLVFSNNIIVETVQQYMKRWALMDASIIPPAGTIVLKNNVFWFSSGIDAATKNVTGTGMARDNNVYHLGAESFLTYVAASTELVTTDDQLFMATMADPSTWDYTLMSIVTSRGITNLNSDSAVTPPIVIPPVVTPPPVVVPLTPSAITGSARVCRGESKTYVVTQTQGVSYVWTVPAGATVTGGSTINAVTVKFGAGFNGGEIKVSAKNGAGVSAGSVLGIRRKRYCS